jgi:hypothetical protein
LAANNPRRRRGRSSPRRPGRYPVRGVDLAGLARAELRRQRGAMARPARLRWRQRSQR